jgi:hypothetical protein
VTYSGIRGESISQSLSELRKDVKSEKGKDPRKDGSLLGDKPHDAGVKLWDPGQRGVEPSGETNRRKKCVRGGNVKAVPSRIVGDP